MFGAFRGYEFYVGRNTMFNAKPLGFSMFARVDGTEHSRDYAGLIFGCLVVVSKRLIPKGEDHGNSSATIDNARCCD